MLSFFSSGQQIGQPKEIYRLSTMAVLLHPRPECLEIQKVLCPIEAILKHSQADCTRLEGSTLVNWKFAKLAGQIRYITGRLVCGSLMWSTKCMISFRLFEVSKEQLGRNRR